MPGVHQSQTWISPRQECRGCVLGGWRNGDNSDDGDRSGQLTISQRTLAFLCVVLVAIGTLTAALAPPRPKSYRASLWTELLTVPNARESGFYMAIMGVIGYVVVRGRGSSDR